LQRKGKFPLHLIIINALSVPSINFNYLVVEKKKNYSGSIETIIIGKKIKKFFIKKDKDHLSLSL
jgi:hypothetical protein